MKEFYTLGKSSGNKIAVIETMSKIVSALIWDRPELTLSILIRMKKLTGKKYVARKISVAEYTNLIQANSGINNIAFNPVFINEFRICGREILN